MQTSRFTTLLLAALGLSPGAAHVLELLPKMQYDGATYFAVTSTLYRLFGSIGAIIQVGALVSAIVLTFVVRRRPAFRLTLAGTLGLALSIVLWAVIVAPVNEEWLRLIESAPGSVVEGYLQLRSRWEYGHVAAFTAWLVGFGLLLASVVSEIPEHR